MTNPIPLLHPDELVRFWSKVSNPDANGCLNWTAAQDGRGYGTFSLRRRSWKAHRVAWYLVHGQPPEGLELDHLCRNRLCVRASHLEPVTHAENMRRGVGGAANKAKVSCPQGHEYTPENVKVYRGRRYCRECHRADARRRRAAQRLTR